VISPKYRNESIRLEQMGFDNCTIVGTSATSKQIDELYQLINAYFQTKFDPPLDIGLYTITLHQVYNHDDTIAPDRGVIQLEVSKARKHEVYFFLDS